MLAAVSICLGLIIAFFVFRMDPKRKIHHNRNYLYVVLKPSDDFIDWFDEFVEASDWLISKGKLSLADIRWSGGWVRSTQEGFIDQYFIYRLKNPRVQNKIYLDVKTGSMYNYFNNRATLIRKGDYGNS